VDLAEGRLHAPEASRGEGRTPGPIRALCRAQAIDTILQEQSGYARTVGTGDNARSDIGNTLSKLWARVEEDYRRIRVGAV